MNEYSLPTLILLLQYNSLSSSAWPPLLRGHCSLSHSFSGFSLGSLFIASPLTACYICMTTFFRCDPSIHTHCDDKQAVQTLSSSVSSSDCQRHGAKPGWQYSLFPASLAANKNSMIPSQNCLQPWSQYHFKHHCCYESCITRLYVRPLTSLCQWPLNPSPYVDDKSASKCLEIIKHAILIGAL